MRTYNKTLQTLKLIAFNKQYNRICGEETKKMLKVMNEKPTNIRKRNMRHRQTYPYGFSNVNAILYFFDL